MSDGRDPAEVVILERAVGRLGELRVGVANIWDRSYVLPDGREVHGSTAVLVMGEDSVVVGAGSVVLGWLVLAVDAGPGATGRIRLSRQPGD